MFVNYALRIFVKFLNVFWHGIHSGMASNIHKCARSLRPGLFWMQVEYQGIALPLG